LLGWEWPATRRYSRPTNKAPVWVRLPAFVDMVCGELKLECFLFPDRGHLPIRAYRSLLAHLVAMRAANGGSLPLLVIATNEGRRIQAWRDALEEAVTSRGEAPLMAQIAVWSDLSRSLGELHGFAHPVGSLGRDSGDRILSRLLRLKS